MADCKTPLLPHTVSYKTSTSLDQFPFVDPSRWSTVDDRVRGGSSVSHLELLGSKEGGEVEGQGVQFFGDLDIKTLGGAGFASQSHTFPSSQPLSISRSTYSGVALTLLPTSAPLASPHQPTTLTLVLKSDAPPKKRPDGRLEATISYEVHADVPPQGGTFNFKWAEFEPTYRGKPTTAPRLKTNEIKAMSLMCRSAFGKQEGPFDFRLERVEGVERSRVGKWVWCVLECLRSCVMG